MEDEDKYKERGEKSGGLGKDLDDALDDVELYKRLLQVSARMAVAQPESPDHPDRNREMSKYWGNLRREAGYPRSEVARKLGMAEQDLAFFEQGLVSQLDLEENFLVRLSEALGIPGAYQRYLEMVRR